MVFKRRVKRSYLKLATESVWPRGGWSRAAQYVNHRLRRIPDAPHRIARGIFAGIFVSFTPLFGLHFFLAIAIAWALRGNILAALMGTFLGNPLTTPFIAVLSVWLGQWMMGIGDGMHSVQIITEFGRAGAEFWNNLQAIFTSAPTRWENLSSFYHLIFLPYLVGGILPGLVAGIAGFYISLPLVATYQKLRKKRLMERVEKLRAQRLAEAAARDAVVEPELPGIPAPDVDAKG